MSLIRPRLLLKCYNIAGLHKRSGIVRKRAEVQRLQITQTLRRKRAVHSSELV